MRTLFLVPLLSLSQVYIKHFLKNLRKALIIKQLQQLLPVLLFRHLPLLLRNHAVSSPSQNTWSRAVFSFSENDKMHINRCFHAICT